MRLTKKVIELNEILSKNIDQPTKDLLIEALLLSLYSEGYKDGMDYVKGFIDKNFDSEVQGVIEDAISK